MHRRSFLKMLIAVPAGAALLVGAIPALAGAAKPNFPSEGVAAKLRQLLPQIDAKAAAGPPDGDTYAQIAALIRTLGP